jgi:general L-amino acid transport system substrate-binding protein
MLRCRHAGPILRLMAWGVAAALPLLPLSALAQTLEFVRERGFLVCGVSEGIPGFSITDASGQWTGYDVDFCRALAAAVLGDAEKVKYRPLTSGEAENALRMGEVDILSRSVAWRLSLEAEASLRFVGVTFFDGQALIVRSDLGIVTALELSGAKICLLAGTPDQGSVADYFESKGMPFTTLSFERIDDARKAYEAKSCDAYVADLSRINAERLLLAEPDDHIVLPEVLSKEPLGPVVRQGDDRWLTIAQWTLFTLINAEELGITAENIDSLVFSNSPTVKRMTELDGRFATALGLDPKWTYAIIKAVGNFGEIFDRNLGAKSALGLQRGFNALWRNGGLIYAPELR